ncbi:MAG: hypothetical protein IJH78_04105 [Clostridia bacterium]|nr:hypothetical protein [Clostridia bacterium]
MPLPLLFIGVAAATGILGAGKSVKAGIDTSAASSINKDAKQLVEVSTGRLNVQREVCGRALRVLGEEKLFVLNNSIKQFLDSFTRIKNVDFAGSEGLEELKKLHIDEREFKELRSMVNFAGSIAGGTAAGTAGGALVAFGAYGAAQAFAAASTGTAIASLSGAAATNATLAFFGGGSIAAGGLGMAGGTAVLGGLVAGPALMVMGFIVGEAARKNLEKARTNLEEAKQVCAELDTGSLQCETIRRRTYMFYNLLARLDARFLPLIYQMEDILKTEGEDYRSYSAGSKKAVAACVSIAVTIKSVLDTPLLTDDGLLTPGSEQVVLAVQDKIQEADG